MCSQLCGGVESDIPITTRLAQYARISWRNKAVTQMMYSVRCPEWAEDTCTIAEDKVSVSAFFKSGLWIFFDSP